MAAARHLIDSGRTRLAMTAGPADMVAATDRLDGFRAALREAGREPPIVAHGDFTRDSGEEAAQEVLRRFPEVDAIFAANDLMGAGALKALRQAGRRVPDDVAVIGFDDIDLARYTDPPLTTVRQPVAEQARIMVEMMLERIEGGPVREPVVLPTRVVQRESA
jgi:DNA-binding LacI/PurR family transcriptional regulator